MARASGRGKGKWRESFREPSGLAPSALRLQGPSSICCAQKTLFQKPAPALILNGTAANGEVPRRSPVGPRSVAGSPMRGWGRTLGPPSVKGASGPPVDRPAFRSSGRQGLSGTTVHYRSLSSSLRGEESPGDCVQVPPVFARTPGPVRNERPTLGPGFGDGSSLGEREAHWRGSPICGRCPRRGHEAKGAQRGYLPSLPACSWPLFGLPWGHGTLIYIRYHY